MSDERPPWIALRTALVTEDAAIVTAALHELGAGEVARALAHLSQVERQQLLELVSTEEAADVLEQLSRAQAADLIEQLEPARAARILHEMPLDAEADILRDLDEDDAQQVLANLSIEDAAELRDITRWDDDVAGGLMGVEFVTVRSDATFSQVTDALREGADTYRDYAVQYIYVVDANEHLEGVLPLRTVVLTAADALVRDHMTGMPQTVEASAELDELAETFDEINYVALPVVDQGRMVGVLRRAVVMEAVGEEAVQEHLKAAGIIGGDELRSMDLRYRASGRLKWLSLNIGLNVLAASVIAMFQDTLQSVVALAVFLPIISDMSGCSGNQAVAVSMRELSLGVATPQDTLFVWGKELAVGVVNGTLLGLLLSALAYAWMGNPWLGLVAGLALTLNTLIAVSIGGTVPLVAKRLGIDPALASGPILTTITDICGFALVLGMATLLLDKLVA